MKFLVIVITLLSIVSCSKLETFENQYANHKDAIDAGAIEKGWIPEVIPKTAFQIYEKHNIDTNESLLRFKCENSFNQTLLDQCKQVIVTEIKWPKLKAAWWPSDLTATSKFSTPRFIFYQCSQDDGFFAIDTKDTEAYFWRRSN